MNSWMKRRWHTILKTAGIPDHSNRLRKESGKRRKKEESKRKKRRKILLDEQTCSGIAVLMENGMTLQDAMNVIEDRRNADAFTLVRERLAKGEQLASFFPSLLPRGLGNVMDGFLQVLPFHQALSLSMTVMANEKQIRQKIIRQMLYPILMMCGTLAGICLFSSFVLPRMISLLASFHVTEGGLDGVRFLIQTVSAVLFVLFLAGSLLAVFCTRPKRIRKTYLFLAAHYRGILMIRHASEDFSRYYLECVRRNISTINTLHLLQNLEGKPLVGLIAEEMDRMLSHGSDFETAVSAIDVDPSLSRFLRTAFHASQCEKMLEGYLQMSSLRTETLIRRFSSAVQLLSYAVIGVMIVFVYLVMLMPMKMMRNL
ncbi:MAG TPA: hypothetical protein DHW39_07275 [Erysipelotrichaceae bacterium]|nr:hypothetical protein [Erysipelotrichaceae bacterium]